MPIYEYQCQDCGHQFDTIQKVSEEPLIECPKCHKNALKKLVSSSAFQLKGTGWYATDFKNSSKKDQNKPEGGASDVPDNKSNQTDQSASTESKAAETPSKKSNQE